MTACTERHPAHAGEGIAGDGIAGEGIAGEGIAGEGIAGEGQKSMTKETQL